MKTFRGQTYMYPTPNDGWREIGVTTGLGTTWIVGWVRDNGSRVRVKTSHLVSPFDPDELQRKLDAWAIARGLARAPEPEEVAA